MLSAADGAEVIQLLLQYLPQILIGAAVLSLIFGIIKGTLKLIGTGICIFLLYVMIRQVFGL